MSEDLSGVVRGSFTDYLREVRPDLLPQAPGGVVQTAHATTILALRTAGGVIIAGDRQATEGYTIAQRDIEKVFPTDTYSAVGISGAAGPAVEMVRLFQVELEYYEKVEGEPLSFEGKANHLGRLIRGNMPAAMQGLVVIPLFAGYDFGKASGRIYRYDVTGGRWEDADFHATGSGGVHARNTLKKRWSSGLTEAEAVRLSLEALTDAADQDTATSGPDTRRGIYPTVYVIDAAGVRKVDEAVVEAAAREVLA